MPKQLWDDRELGQVGTELMVECFCFAAHNGTKGYEDRRAEPSMYNRYSFFAPTINESFWITAPVGRFEVGGHYDLPVANFEYERPARKAEKYTSRDLVLDRIDGLKL